MAAQIQSATWKSVLIQYIYIYICSLSWVSCHTCATIHQNREYTFRQVTVIRSRVEYAREFHVIKQNTLAGGKRSCNVKLGTKENHQTCLWRTLRVYNIRRVRDVRVESDTKISDVSLLFSISRVVRDRALRRDESSCDKIRVRSVFVIHWYMSLCILIVKFISFFLVKWYITKPKHMSH